MSEALAEHFGTTDLPEGYRLSELGPLPEEWRVVRLEEIVSITRKARKMPSPDPVPFIPMEAIPDDGSLYPIKIEYKLIDDVRSGTYCEGGDILFAKITPSLENGKQVMVPPHIRVAYATTEVYPLKVNLDKLDPFYLFVLLRAPWVRTHFAEKMEGSTGRQRLAQQVLLSFPIPLPPLPEQRAIAHMLRAVQRAREATERVIAALRELKKSLMRHLFTYGPVPVDAADQVPMQETDIGPIPAHWRVVRLGEVILTIQNGSTKEQNKRGQGIPVTRIETIALETIDPARVGYVERMSADEIEKYRLQIGDILFSHINSEAQIGKSAIYEGNPPFLIHGMNLLLIKTNPTKCSPHFLRYLFKLYKERGVFSGLAARAVGQASINQGKMKGLIIPLPPLPEQQEIARILQTVDRKLEAEEARKQALEALFKTLLHDLMTAKIRLPAWFIAQFTEQRESTSSDNDVIAKNPGVSR